MLLDLRGLTNNASLCLGGDLFTDAMPQKSVQDDWRCGNIQGCERPWIKYKILLCQAWRMIGHALPVDISHNRVILDGPRAMFSSLRLVIAVLYALISMS